MSDTRQWKPIDGYFGHLLNALLGRADRRVEGDQESGGTSGSGAGYIITADGALKLSAVWACIRLLAETIGSMPIEVYRIDADGTRTLDNTHNLNRTFKRPNVNQTRNEFVETLMISLGLSGNSYCRKERLVTGGFMLMPIMASQVTVKWFPSTGRVYEFREGNKVTVIPQENMWHIPLMPSNGIVGLSPLQYGARTMGIATAAENRVGDLASNNFKPNGYLYFDKSLTAEQRKDIRREYRHLVEGTGDPLHVMEAGVRFETLSVSPKDAQLLESRHFSIEDICRFYGVPSILINDNTATTQWGTGVSEIKEGFYTFTIRPLLEKIEASIVRWLLPITEQDKIEVKFDFDALLRGNEAKRVETGTKAISGKLMTQDEARKRYVSLPPLPDGIGGVIYDQGQMVPLGSGEENDDAQPAED